jgi:hypothetical protein
MSFILVSLSSQPGMGFVPSLLASPPGIGFGVSWGKTIHVGNVASGRYTRFTKPSSLGGRS